MSAQNQTNNGYHFVNRGFHSWNEYLVKPVLRALESAPSGRPDRVFDLGCGNGSWARLLTDHGYQVIGVDPSEEGIAIAKELHPDLSIYRGSAYDDLYGRYGAFPACLSIEVVEHLYDPRKYAATLYQLVAPNGIAIVTTPYHGYLKILVVGIVGRWDSHFSPLWDHGHIKFWSMKTLALLLRDAGFRRVRFERPGRCLPCLARSMMAVAYK